MKILLYIVFCFITYYMFFGFNKCDFKPKGWYIALPPALIITPIILIGLILKISYVEWEKFWADLSWSVMLSSLILSLMVFFKFIIPKGFSLILNFHKTYNSQNINKGPVKFVITHYNRLILGFYITAFLGSLIIFYGAFFGEK